MKFIHTADLHIDQPFSGINSDESQIKEILKNAKQSVLSKIVDVCIEKKVDFLLFVGDTFHRNQPSIHTQKLVIEQFNRLKEEGIKVVMSFGNHDYYTPNRYWFDWPDNVILFKKEEVQTKVIQLRDGESVSISGFSYEHLWIEQSMVSQFPNKQLETTYHIGFYHGDQSERYAPFSLSSLPHNYDYWALGHIHKAEIVSNRPFVAYSGTPQGHNRKETQVNGVLLVELDQAQPKVEWIDVATIKWYQEELAITEEMTKQDLLKEIESVVLSKEYSNQLNVVSLQIKATPDNAKTIIDENEELLQHLQETIFKQSHQTIWLKEIHTSQEQTENLIMGFEVSLIDDLARKYKQKEVFEKSVNDLTKQPSISNHIFWDEYDMIELVDDSSQLIKEKMIFKDGEKR